MKREQIIQWVIAVVAVVVIFLIVTRDRDAHALTYMEYLIQSVQASPSGAILIDDESIGIKGELTQAIEKYGP